MNRPSLTIMPLLLLVGFLLLCLGSSQAFAQSRDQGKSGSKSKPEYFTQGEPHVLVEANLDSGFIANATISRVPIYSEIIEAPGADWMRIQFETAHLGAAQPDGRNTIVQMTSLLDGAVQTMNALHLRQWRNTSAYFNGDTVLVEIIADPDAQPSRITITRVMVGQLAIEVMAKSICGSTDDRVLDNDPRAGRGLPAGCTAWLIDGTNSGGRPGSLLSAGHCFALEDVTVIQFNVPLSSSNGAINHPPPSDQYALDTNSLQFTPGPNIGNDWAYFGCFPNSTTGLSPLETQGRAYRLDSAAPVASNQTLRINGYGTTSAPVSRTWNLVGKVHQGPYADHLSTALLYQIDTTGGNSGSSVELLSTAKAIGIHTNGGCSTQSGSANFGTAIENLALQQALHTPLGVTWPCHGSDIDGDGEVSVVDLLALLASWGACGVSCSGDRDLNGVVDVIDLIELLALWGTCSPGGDGPFLATVPPNDLCVNAIAITDDVTDFDTTWALTDGPNHFECNAGGDNGVTVNDIWFLYTASCTGMLEVSTCGIASYDTDLVLYSGDCTSLIKLECSDDATGLTCGGAPLFQSHIENVPVVEGEVLVIRVGGWFDVVDDSGPGTLSVTCTP